MKTLLAIIRAFLVLLHTLFLITLLAIEGLVLGRTENRSFKYRRRWGRGARRILGIQLDEVSGNMDGIQNALVVSNHRTLLDPVIAAMYIDAYIIAKAEVANLPIISQGAQMTGIIFVKRESIKSRMATRTKTKETLQEGKSVLVYAEGTTGTDQCSDPFKPGTMVLAAELGLPVVPVSIEYGDEKDFWYEGGLGTQMVRQVGSWRTRAKLRIHPPITNTDGKLLTKQVKEVIDNGLKDMQKDWSNVFSQKTLMVTNSTE